MAKPKPKPAVKRTNPLDFPGNVYEYAGESLGQMRLRVGRTAGVGALARLDELIEKLLRRYNKSQRSVEREIRKLGEWYPVPKWSELPAAAWPPEFQGAQRRGASPGESAGAVPVAASVRTVEAVAPESWSSGDAAGNASGMEGSEPSGRSGSGAAMPAAGPEDPFGDPLAEVSEGEDQPSATAGDSTPALAEDQGRNEAVRGSGSAGLGGNLPQVAMPADPLDAGGGLDGRSGPSDSGNGGGETARKDGADRGEVKRGPGRPPGRRRRTIARLKREAADSNRGPLDWSNVWPDLPESTDIRQDVLWVYNNFPYCVETHKDRTCTIWWEAARTKPPSVGAIAQMQFLENDKKHYTGSTGTMQKILASMDEPETESVKDERRAIEEVEKLLRKMQETPAAGLEEV